MKISILLSLLVLLIVTSCKKPDPVACINIIPSKYEVDDEINFTAACSENGVSYGWDFKDGTTSTDFAPSHTYTTPGTYVVELKAFSKKEKSVDIATRTIEIKSRPQQITIVYVELISFQQYNSSGNYWDSDIYPDIRLSVFDSDVTHVDGAEIQNNAVFNQSYNYYLDFPITLAYDNDYHIGLIDVDGSSIEMMEGIEFDPSKYSLSDPTSIELTKGDYHLRLQVEWAY